MAVVMDGPFRQRLDLFHLGGVVSASLPSAAPAEIHEPGRICARKLLQTEKHTTQQTRHSAAFRGRTP
jgi:hypothetical protein